MPQRNIEGQYPYAYQGQEKDAETGMEAFELRLWDARIGRWLTTDPYGQFSSPYLGMGNNPVAMIDPDGGFTKLGAWWHKLWNGGEIIEKHYQGNENYKYYAVIGGKNSDIAVSRSAINNLRQDMADDLLDDMRFHNPQTMDDHIYSQLFFETDSRMEALGSHFGLALFNISPGMAPGVGASNTASTASTPLTKNAIVEGLKVSNHAWRKSGLGRGATEELVSATIRGAKNAGTVITEVGQGKFAGNVIKVYNYNNIKVAVDETRSLIMSIRPLKGFKVN